VIKLDSLHNSSSQIWNIFRVDHDGVKKLESRFQYLVCARMGMVVGSQVWRPPQGDVFIEHDDVQKEVFVQQVDDDVNQIFGVTQFWACHRSSDVENEYNVHGDDVEVRQGRRSVVEVSEEAFLGHQVWLPVGLDVVLELHVAGKALVAEVVELKRLFLALAYYCYYYYSFLLLCCQKNPIGKFNF